MKLIPLLFLMTFSCTIYAQKSIFVRIYDLNGKKINKGVVFSVTDSSIQLMGKDIPIDIPISKIGSVKTKRSPGNNLLKGAAISAPILSLLFFVSGTPTKDMSNGLGSFLEYTPGQGAIGGALIGLPVGAAIGGLTISFKKSRTFLIDGDLMKWKAFQTFIFERK